MNNNNNNLAPTPPMGWNSYNTYNCEPSEELIKKTADAMISTGLKDAGYEYINIDDGWMAPQRDNKGNLYPDPKKFPNGLKVVTDYIHEKGLKAGIYLGAGLKTYGEMPGSFGYEKKDANLIASLGFDLLKYDFRDLPEDPPGRDVKTEYINMRKYLDNTGRQILFSICEHGRSNPWEWGAGVGHMWRITPDIKDGFDGDIKWGWGFNKIIDKTHHLYKYAGPGHWNDPDMLIVGLNGKIDWQGPGCTIEEYKTHFALWCLSAAPLLIGCDIHNMDKDIKEILLNKELIGINQDILGKQGYIAKKYDNTDIWLKPLSNKEYALGLYNRSKLEKEIPITWKDIGFDSNQTFNIRDLWKHCDLGKFKKEFTQLIPSHGIGVYKIKSL